MYGSVLLECGDASLSDLKSDTFDGGLRSARRSVVVDRLDTANRHGNQSRPKVVYVHNDIDHCRQIQARRIL